MQTEIQIKAPSFKTAVFKVVGTAPLVMNKFAQKAREQMRARQELGPQAKKNKVREAKDFDACLRGALHFSREGWVGFPAAGFRRALITACKLVGFKMTIAKLALFVEADGNDADDGTPLVKIRGEYRPIEMAVRNDSGVADVRIRPLFEKWEASLKIRFDLDIFSLTDVANLVMRAGGQVGIGEGRPDSPMSAGMGWGLFESKEGK